MKVFYDLNVPVARLKVECYAGHKASERPVRFFVHGQEKLVDKIVERWYGPEDSYFRVLASDGRSYLLRHTPGEQGDFWTLED